MKKNRLHSAIKKGSEAILVEIIKRGLDNRINIEPINIRIFLSGKISLKHKPQRNIDVIYAAELITRKENLAVTSNIRIRIDAAKEYSGGNKTISSPK